MKKSNYKSSNVKFVRHSEITQPSPAQKNLSSWKYPDKPNDRIHADLGHFHDETFLALNDQHSKWLEIYWMTTATAEMVIRVFKDYFARWGLPKVVVTDNRPPFSVHAFVEFLTSNGVKHMTIPPFITLSQMEQLKRLLALSSPNYGKLLKC